MCRVLNMLLVFLAILVLKIDVTAQEQPDKKLTFLDQKSAGPDFLVQGEYIGKVGEQSYGVQVIALGSGKFDAVILTGGLPGAGWDTSRREIQKATGETTNGTTRLTGVDLEATISATTMRLKLKDKSGELKKLHRESPTIGMVAPQGATILFDGSNVDEWNPGVMEEGGLMGIGTRTKKTFENYTLHLEFRTPFMPHARGQGRGNSGMYLGDQYECQILDSFGLEGADNECGGIYKNAKPLVNMCLPPLSWQTYDVEFTSAKFDESGKVVSPAKTTIKHNGTVIHKELNLNVTPGGGRSDQKPGSIFLQDHGNPVRFKNIWIVERK